MKHVLFSLIAISALAFTSCSVTHKMMREPNVVLELDMDDLELSEQVTGQASSTKIIGIDWARLLKFEAGYVQGGGSLLINLASIPVMGPYVIDQTMNYALYEMMMENPGYDVVLYPQFEKVYERPILGLGFIYMKTEVKATARLGKLKSE